MSDVLFNVHSFDQRAVDLNAVAAAAVAAYELLRTLPDEIFRESGTLSWFRLLRLFLRGFAVLVLILNASQLGFARTQEWCRAASFLFPIAIEVLVVLTAVLFARHAVNFCSIDTRTGHFVLYGFAVTLLIAQVTTFVITFVLQPPQASAMPDSMTGCISHRTPYDRYGCFWWPALALQILFVINAGVHVSGSSRVAGFQLSDNRASFRTVRSLYCFCYFPSSPLPISIPLLGPQWFVAALSISLSYFQLDEHSSSAHPSIRVSSQPPSLLSHDSPESLVSRRSCSEAYPRSPTFLEGFVTVPLPAELRNLTSKSRRPTRVSDVPSVSSLQSIPSIATTIEFAPRTSMSPRNSRVDANFDVGREYIPFSRRAPLPTEWRSLV
ncbi:hypothetical protein BKA62DRAFT_765235 [Auriculariales sp. MPI-PUGE-AT-0066]|nr:hypothetical protein BKA62DRAFT_765235 [Auriculariales sp. MPI-PUGE-AT-0066]